MEKINVQTPDGITKMEGERISSTLKWSKNVEQRKHLQGGTYSTKQVPTDCYEEVWNIDGKEIKLLKLSTGEGDKYMI